MCNKNCGECSKAVPMTRIDDIMTDTIYIYCVNNEEFEEVLKYQDYNKKYMKKYKEQTEEYETEEDINF